MIRRIVIYMCVAGMVILSVPLAHAQLGSIGSFGLEVQRLFADTVTQKLYMTSLTPSTFDGKPIKGPVYHDFITGLSDTMPTSAFKGATFYSILRIDSFIYFGGPYDTVGGNNGKSHIKYDGQNWKFNDPGYFNLTPQGTGEVNALYNDGDSVLYLGTGGKKFISPINNNIVGRNLTTNAWVHLPLLDTINSNTINAITRYQGDIYACGDFKLPGNNGYGIARLVNNTWQKLGAGIPSSYIYQDMIEYNGMLIVSGGNSYVNAWNGSQWLNIMAMPGPTVNRVYDLEVYNGVLYAAGWFILPDGSTNVAKWDGNNWVGIGLNSFSGFGGGWVKSIQIYNNTLYIGGNFSGINGQTYIAAAKYDNLVGIAETSLAALHLTSYPNPAADKINITCPVSWENQRVSITVINLTGQVVHTTKATIINGSTTIALQPMVVAGMYAIILRNEKVWGKTVMVKE